MAFTKNTFFTLFTTLLLSSCNILIPDGKDITEPNFAPGYTEPAISISDTSAIESSDLTFTVTLSKTYSSAITIDYTTSNDSATAGSDYTATSGTLTIAKGATSATITVPVTDDTNDESNENLTMTLSNASKGTFDASSATGTIVDDDGEPTISINDVSASENAGQATFTVSLSNPSSSIVTVDYATSDGTATTADSDYTATSGTLTFNPGDTTKTFNVTITNDAKNEASETYTVTISNPTNATISDATGTGTITNDDAAPSLSISDVSVAENVGAGVATFTVTLSAVSGQTVTVDCATSDGTATTADSDYTATSGTLTFNPGDTTKTFNVTITNDAKNEASETYTVTISNPSNATISDATGTGTITNDDAVPSLAVNDVTVDEDAGTATFTVTQSAVSGQTVTVDYATSNGTATAGSDYTAASGTLTFNPGDTTKTFNVTITNDTSDEADETYTVTISNPTNATISDATSIGTITDNDVTVDQTDDDNTATGFGGGSHTGTTYTSGVLTLNTTTNNAELDESWTPQWDNLVAYWKMDETSWNGTANEVIDSIGSNHGVRVGDATTTSSAKIGDYAGTFDGTGDYVQIADADNLSFASTTSKLSFSTWVYISGTTGTADQVILGKYNSNASKIEYLFVYNTTNKYLELRVSEDGTSGTFWSTRANLVFDAIGAWFHFVVTLDVGTDTVNYYINGQSYGSVNTAGASINAMENFNEPFRIATVTCLSGSTCGYLNGKIDDVAIWDTVISTDEVAIIYSRQSAKYAGEMKSRIIDSQDASASWTNLDWLTTLPFGKELPSSSESSADYSDLYSDGLMDGLVGLWHLNSNTWSDSSGLNYAGTSGGNVSISSFGLLSNAAEFDGDKDYIELPASSTILSGDTSLTLSAWFKTSLTYDTTGKGVNYGARLFSIYKTDAPAGYSSKIGLGFYGDNTDTLFIYHTPANSALTYTNSGFNDGKWHHLLCTYNATNDELKLYYDGVEVASANSITLSDAGTNLMHIGDFDPADTEGSFNGLIDEAAVWNRALDADEVLEFYRRGANRIKYQVRSCSSADCSDQDALTGDGWQGPGGNYLTYFSELYNNSSISSSCAIPQACAASELSLDGDVQTSSPSLRFDDFGADGIYMNNNRYFQYRVIMESDDENTACNGGTSTCHPELKSVEIGPAHTYEQ